MYTFKRHFFFQYFVVFNVIFNLLKAEEKYKISSHYMTLFSYIVLPFR